VVVALALAQALMAPPSRDLRALALYLAVSGVTTLAAGWAGLRLADRVVGLTLHARAFLAAITGSVVALLNVFICAQLMFLNTAHDLKLLVALLIFSGIVTAFFSLWVASTIAGRLSLITTGIGALAAGDYAVQVPVQGRDEIARLAHDLNALARRLQASEAQRAALDRERRELTAAISHDLRTPLASVRAMVEALDDRIVDDPEEVSRYYGTIRREIERLNRLIDDLFELAQLDAGVLRLNRRPVALEEIAAEVVDAMQAQARRHEVTLSLRVEGELPTLALDGARIERAIANLVRNALEHTPSGGTIDVAVCMERGQAVLTVSDTGEGIDPAELPRLWERFSRGERSRQRGPRAADGAGLGLAIVRGIVEAHGGQIGASSTPGHGSVFEIRLGTSFPAQEGGAHTPCIL
jgi:signal transduction histidine kinase